MKNEGAKIKVIGIGGSGCNAITRMMTCGAQGVDLIAINTDAQDLKKTKAHLKLRIGQETTKGLGVGMNPTIGRKAAEESRMEISDILKGSDMIFITCGLGGGTGSGVSPVVAEIAKEQGVLTIAVVTKPFSFEGSYRQNIAEKSLLELKDKVDTLLIVLNDKLLSLVDYDASLLKAFWICDEVLRQAVQGISDLIVLPGIINVDFADVKTIMKDSGPAWFGVGRAFGEKRAEKAALQAINSPLLGMSWEGGGSILFNVSGGEDLGLWEVDEAAKIITQKLQPKARIIFGAVHDKRLKKGELKITVIATGF